MISHSCFALHCTDNNVKHLSLTHWPSVCLCSRSVYLHLLLLLSGWIILLLTCLRSLYSLYSKSLSDIQHVKRSSHSWRCLFILIVASVIQKLRSLIEIQFVYFCFYFLCVRGLVCKPLPVPMSWSIFPLFSSASLGFKSHI